MNDKQYVSARKMVGVAREVASLIEDTRAVSVLSSLSLNYSGEQLAFEVRVTYGDRFRGRIFGFQPGDTREVMLSLIQPWLREAVYSLKTTP